MQCRPAANAGADIVANTLVGHRVNVMRRSVTVLLHCVGELHELRQYTGLFRDADVPTGERAPSGGTYKRFCKGGQSLRQRQELPDEEFPHATHRGSSANVSGCGCGVGDTNFKVMAECTGTPN